MNFLDVRTVLFSSIITSAICALVMNSLWQQNRRRSPELAYWLADFILQFVAILLIALRGILPDVVSVLFGVPCSLLGALLMFIGLERYAGKASTQRYNFILLAGFTLVHGYFIYAQPSLPARNINLSLGLLVVCSQCAWLLLRRVDSEIRLYTKTVGAIFAAYSLVSFVRIFVDLAMPRENDLFKSGLYDVLAILVYQMLFISLTFALVLMVNRRLFSALDSDMAERKRMENEQFRLLDIIEKSLNEIYVFDATTLKFKYLNQGALQNIGYSLAEMKNMTPVEIKPEYTDAAFRAMLQPLLDGEQERLVFETIHQRKDGTQYPVEVRLQLFRQAGKSVFFAVINDVTERKRADAELSQTLERLNLATHAARLGIWDWDIQKNELIWDERMYALYGIQKESFGGAYEAWLKGLHPDDRAMSDEISKQALQGEREYDTEFRVIWPDGSVHILKAEGLVIRGADGTPLRMTGVNYDITERKQALEEIQHLSRFPGENPNPVLRIGRDGKILYGNHACTPILAAWGREAGQDVPADWRTQIASIFDSGENREVEMDCQGQIFSCSLTPILDEGYVNLYGRDITERKRAEEALRESERKLREAQEMAHLGFWSWDVKTGEVEWSDEVFKIFCLEPKEFTPQIDSILALSPWPEDHQRDQELINRAVETHSPGSYEQKFLRPDQNIGYYYSTFQGNYAKNGDLISIVGTVLDITERKQAEEKLIASETRYRRLFEAARDGILILDAESGVVVDVNPFLVEMLGFPLEKILGKELWELGFFKDIAANKANFLELQQEEYVRYEDLPLETAHGKQFHVEFVSNVYQVEHHKVVQCNIRDITERRRAENALRESEDKFKYVFEYSVVGKSITQFNGRMQVNRALCDMLGYSPGEMQAKKWQEITHPDDIELTQKEIDALLSGEKESARFVKRFIHKNGSIVWVDLSSTIRRDGQHKPLYLMSAVIDITERKRAEDELLESEKKYRTLFEKMNAGFVLFEAVQNEQGIPVDLIILAANVGFEKTTGLKLMNSVGKHLTQVLPGIEKDEADWIGIYSKVALTGESVQFEQGSELLGVHYSISAFQAGPKQCAVTFVDITKRKQADDDLRESEERYRSLFENMLNGFAYCQMLFDQERPQDFIYLEVNHAFETLTGLKNVVGKKVTEVIPGIRESDPGLFEIYGRVALTGLPESFEVYVEALEMWFFISVYSPQKRYFVAIFDVITERKRAEQELKAYSEGLEARVVERTRELIEAQEKLVRQERLATLGQLAGSIGHELRNPLGVISNAIYYLKMAQPEASDKVREYLEIIEKETRTSDKIVTDLLDFTRIKSINRRAASVSELVRQTLERYPVPPSVQVTLEIPANLPQIYADPQQVIQVLGNLTVNACQAMVSTSSTNGVSTPLRGQASSVHGVSVDVTKLTISAAVQGAMMMITVRDTGTGITPENMKKLFEPLFSTKNTGIGLGLAVSKKLAEANGGRIEAHSELGQGSTFTLSLPVYLAPQV